MRNRIELLEELRHRRPELAQRVGRSPDKGTLTRRDADDLAIGVGTESIPNGFGKQRRGGRAKRGLGVAAVGSERNARVDRGCSQGAVGVPQAAISASLDIGDGTERECPGP